MSTKPPALGRRALLLAGAAGLVAGCSSSPGSAPSTPSGGITLPPPTPTPTGSGGPLWSQLRRQLTGILRLPGDPGYDEVRLTENPAYDASRPLGVLTAATSTDVAAAITFARNHQLPIQLRSGGHSYPGWSSGGGPGTGRPRALVLDCRSLDTVGLAGDGTATLGAGAALAAVYDAVGGRGRAIAGGSCATVGVGGLTLGGGVGVLTRALGLTCDAVRSMQVVTADGALRTVDADHDPDLFWALRGGGGGHLGVVTGFGFATVAAPTMSTCYLTWPFAAAAQVIEAWQSWAPGADPRLWSTLKLLGGATHPSGPTVLLSGTWTGPATGFAGQLAGLLDHVPPPSINSTARRSYHDAMMSYAGCATLPIARCHTGPGGSLSRAAFAATSHVGYQALSAGGIDTLIGQVDAAQGSGLHEAGISMDALGGHVRDLAPDATAFVHRQALMTVQYTATYTGNRLAAARSYVRGFRSAMSLSWGNHAYVNYADQAVPDPATAYFGANATRLRQVKQAYDPDDFFDQPQGY